MSLSKPDADQRIGARYRVLDELGRGGVARVYRVLDDLRGEQLALKLLTPNEREHALLLGMFEREYHVLVQLTHPRIVRAFDYGYDGEQPYYTMELLEGADLRTFTAARAGALPSGEVCALLRDVASALAFVHSRRLVHRDLSPRNVWRAIDGRAKLIDFGSLAAIMGAQARVVGTVPFIAPEALYAQPLDARVDLYGLGALAYFLLTRRHAYPARRARELPALWAQPPARPELVEPTVPRALSDLVMALLSLDRRGRPASAAEVVARLNELAQLPAEDDLGLAQAYLAIPSFVGRAEATAFVRGRMARTPRGAHGSIAVIAEPGLGRSRMLAQAALEARLLGAAVASVVAGALGNEPFALATALAERVLEMAPTAAAASLDRALPIGHLSAALHEAFGSPELPALSEQARARDLTAAFVALLSEAARNQFLVLVVDDLEQADSASLGVLARLFELLERPRVFLLASCARAALPTAPPLLEHLVARADHLELPPLGLDDTRALLSSMFGDVPELEDLAQQLQALSHGSPEACVQYAQHLVDRGLARYEAGRWHLPERLRELPLPSTLSAVLAERVARLSPDARALGLALGLVLLREHARGGGQSEARLLPVDYPLLLEGAALESRRPSQPRPGAARAFAAIDELVRAGLLGQDERGYVVRQRAMSEVLVREADPDELQRAHARLGHVYTQPSYRHEIASVYHLQHAGLHARARERLQKMVTRLGGAELDYASIRVSVGLDCAATALEQLGQHGGAAREAFGLRKLLLLIALSADWALARYGDAQLAQLRHDLGLAHWDATDPALPAAERARACFQHAQQRHDATPEAERVLSPQEALNELPLCAMMLYGVHASRHDIPALRALPPLLEPLRALSPTIEVVWGLSKLALERTTGRAMGDRTLEAVAGLLAAPNLPDLLRLGGTGTMLYVQALEDVRRGSERALSLVDLIVPVAGEEMFWVVHTRWLCHAFRGHADRAAFFRRRACLVAEDDIWRRNASLFFEAELHALTGDVESLARSHAELAELAMRFVGFRPWAHFARGALLRLKGEFDAAQVELSQAVALAPPGEHRAWTRAAPALAELCLQRGEPEAAARQAEAILATTGALDLDPLAALHAERIAALAASAQAAHEIAAQRLAWAFERAAQLECDGLPLALLYEAQVRILLAAGQREQCAAPLAALRALIEHAEAPAFVQAYEALRAQTVGGAGGSLPSSAAAEQSKAVTSLVWTRVESRLGAHGERAERAQQALAMLLDDGEATSGELYLLGDDGLYLAASSEVQKASAERLAVARRQLDLELGHAHSEAVTADVGVPAAVPRTGEAAEDSQCVLLCDERDGRTFVTGMAFLYKQGASTRAPRAVLIRAISRCLEQSGDSLACPLDA